MMFPTFFVFSGLAGRRLENDLNGVAPPSVDSGGIGGELDRLPGESAHGLIPGMLPVNELVLRIAVAVASLAAGVLSTDFGPESLFLARGILGLIPLVLSLRSDSELGKSTAKSVAFLRFVSAFSSTDIRPGSMEGDDDSGFEDDLGNLSFPM